MRSTLKRVAEGEPDGVIMHRGPVLAGLSDPAAGALVLHLSAGTELSPSPFVKSPVSGPEEALQLGADAVSVHVTLGVDDERDARALAALDRCSTECRRWGIPLLAMMYVHGVAKPDAVVHAARVAADLGADLVKVNYTGDPESFARLVQTCYVPVLMAGGPSVGDGLETLKTVADAIAAGAAGVCIGRNVYQHPSPTSMLRALGAVVHGGATPRRAFDQHLVRSEHRAAPRPTAAAEPL
jgi:DhnA family fructose-bisphosphate aldolase class Ia